MIQTMEDRIISSLASGRCSLPALVERIGGDADGKIVLKLLHSMAGRQLVGCGKSGGVIEHCLSTAGWNRAAELGKAVDIDKPHKQVRPPESDPKPAPVDIPKVVVAPKLPPPASHPAPAKCKDGYQIRPFIPARPRLTVKLMGGVLILTADDLSLSPGDPEKVQQIIIDPSEAAAFCDAILAAACHNKESA